MRFNGVEVEQETSAPPPKKNPGPAPERLVFPHSLILSKCMFYKIIITKQHREKRLEVSGYFRRSSYLSSGN